MTRVPTRNAVSRHDLTFALRPLIPAPITLSTVAACEHFVPTAWNTHGKVMRRSWLPAYDVLLTHGDRFHVTSVDRELAHLAPDLTAFLRAQCAPSIEALGGAPS